MFSPQSFLRSAFSEPDGNGSSTRLLSAMLISFVIGVGAALVTKVHTPVTVADINSFLGASGIFIATTVTPMYLINKGSNVMNNKTIAGPMPDTTVTVVKGVANVSA